jgi:hypothetical protein
MKSGVDDVISNFERIGTLIALHEDGSLLVVVLELQPLVPKVTLRVCVSGVIRPGVKFSRTVI